jgi:hypothetical protein
MALVPLLWVMVKKLHPVVEKLLAEIEAYRAMADVDKTNFGIGALNDGHFITRLEHGRVPNLVTIDRVRAYIDSKTKAVRK